MTNTVLAGYVTDADLHWWLDLAPDLKWRFASTMPDTPHSYVVRGQTLNEDDFVRAVKVIRTFGEPGKFYDHTNIYLVHNGQKWWTMGESLDECRIINIATTERTYGKQDAPHTYSGIRSVYDALAPIYDRRYDDRQAYQENQHIWRLITGRFPGHPNTLDVGCGTGLLLDLSITRPAHYIGVDPSQAMLNELIRKHPRVERVIPKRMEDAIDSFTRPFELVVGLFGAPSYISPDTIKRLPSLASKMLVLMHYEPGYLPDYWEGLERPQYLDSSRRAARALLNEYPGEFSTLNHFHIVTLWMDRHVGPR